MTRAKGPYVSGTVISSSDVNAEMSDLATELTDSLSRSGKGGMTAPLRTANGTAADPAHSFTSDHDTGAYLAAAGDLRLAVGGVDRLTLGTGATIKGASDKVTITSAAADGASAVGVVLDNSVALADAGAKLLSVRNAGVERAYVGELGEGVFGLGDPANGVTGQGTGYGGRFTAAGPTDGTGILALGYGAGAGIDAQAGGTGAAVVATGNGTRGAVQLVGQAEPSSALAGDLWYGATPAALRVLLGSLAHNVMAARVSADRGDTNQTLAVGTDATVQRWATTLTANRTVTLSTTGAVNGQWFRVVRTGLGAFTLNVGGLKTIPNSTAAYVDVMFDGSAWVLVGYGAL